MSATQAQPNGHPSPAASSHTQTAATASTSALPRLHYGGYDRFELELEFVQMLSNPLYLQHLASQKILDSDDLLAYVDYLQYFRRPEYLPYLQYPGPTLRALELIPQEAFRRDILVPDVVARLMQEGIEASHQMG